MRQILFPALILPAGCVRVPDGIEPVVGFDCGALTGVRHDR